MRIGLRDLAASAVAKKPFNNAGAPSSSEVARPARFE